jgi:hypothetical protein
VRPPVEALRRLPNCLSLSGCPVTILLAEAASKTQTRGCDERIAQGKTADTRR